MTGPTATVTRNAIAKHARELFLDSGYAGASVRQIAAAAGVDAALVIRYFGSKERLFLEVIQIDAGPVLAADESTNGLGARLLDRIIMASRSDLEGYQLLLRASSFEGIPTALIAQFEQSLVIPLAALLGEPSGVIRARLVASALLGLMVSVTLYREDTLINLPEGELSRLYAPALQAIIDGDEA